MAGITDAISSLISSILDIFRGILNTFLAACQSLFAITKGAIESVFNLAGNLISSLIDLFSGFVGFVLGNLVIIAVIVAGVVGYRQYQARQQSRQGWLGGKKNA